MFNTLCYYLNFIPGLSYGVAGLRWMLFHALATWRRECPYPKPDEVCGYRSWVEVPILGTLAFRHDDTGVLQFRW